MSGFARGVEWASRLAGYVAVALLLLSILVVCQMLWVRFVMGQSAIWQNEMITFAIIGATFLGAPVVLLERGHVNVDLLPQLLGSRGRYFLGLLASTIGLAFCLVLFVTSLEWWWEAYAGGFRTSSIWRARLWIPYSALPIGAGLLVLQYVVEIWAIATGRSPPFGPSVEGGI